MSHTAPEIRARLDHPVIDSLEKEGDVAAADLAARIREAWD
ncbi:MAG: hypothetical protein P8R42_28305 [Candidatus Binatia bacterium]|nr:hypothetical protein [Candidatus Binatia bacterium]